MKIEVHIDPPVVKCNDCGIVLNAAFALWKAGRDKHGATMAIFPYCDECYGK